jgi:2',3'-cyclic-nucleotide 2'-phosphodiesterase (5'-nucleotidase family)
MPHIAVRRALSLLPLAALAWSGAAAAQDFRPAVTVVQLNDVYRIDAVENGAAGGLGRVVTLVDRLKRQGVGQVAVLHAGDFIAPSLESRYFAGRQMIDALNYVAARAPLVAVPGNHEFDERDPAMIAGAIRMSRFPWLAGNVRLSTGDAAADGRLGGDTVVTWGGLRVGIFTLTYIDAPRTYATVDTAVVAAAERQIRRLEERGADVIVGLTHLALDDDRRVAALKATHPKLAWIAGGHEHYLIREDATDTKALITKGDSNARRVWQVSLAARDGRPLVHARPVPLDASVAVEPGYAQQVTRRWADSMQGKVPFFHAVIGRASTRLDGSEETVRDRESNWGSWLADQMRGAFPDVRADVAILNGGAIRIDDAFTGDVRWEHLARTFGFPTRVALVWLRGKDLRETVLERAVSGGRGEGRFLQVSGVRFRFDRRRPVGQRVTEVGIQQGTGYTPLVDDRLYVVAVPDYLYGGGDGYTFKQRAVMAIPPGPDVKLIAFDALSAAYARGQAIAPQVEGRIVEDQE